MRQRLLFYNSMIRSVLHYVSSIWTSCDKENLGRVLKLQKRAARVISAVTKSGTETWDLGLGTWDAETRTLSRKKKINRKPFRG